MAFMKITVRNFGPIGEAKDIQISPITLFVGPSNTGKSYLAVVLYSIVKILTIELPLSVIHMLRNEYAQKPANDLTRNNGKESYLAEKEIQKLTNAIFPLWAKNTAQAWQREIVYCLGEEGSNILKEGNMSVILESDDKNISLNLTSPSESRIALKTQIIINKELSISIQRRAKRLPRVYDFDNIPRMLVQFLSEQFLFKLQCLLGDFTNAHYLPAIRGGIMQSHRGLVDAVMAQAPMAGLGGEFRQRGNSVPMFTGVLSDFMRKLINLPRAREAGIMHRGSNRTRDKAITNIGEHMESDIMDGSIEDKRSETGYPDFRYTFSKNGKPRNMSLKNTSSMVSELAPVSIFIRHHLCPDDLFIVEEPEAHLHPKGQRAISDILAQLANAGVFVLATTHSDIVLEQISNAVHASQLKPGVKVNLLGNKNGRGGAPLEEKQTSAYSFGERKQGATAVKRIPFDSDAGFMTKDHFDVIKDLYNESVELLDNKK